MAEVKYVDGNVNNAVIVHGDDPTNKDNALVTPIHGAVSVPKESLTDADPGEVVAEDSGE